MPLPTAVVAPAGLVAGYAAGRYLHRRDLAGVVSAAAAAWCTRQWTRAAGPAPAGGLLALYVGGLGASHPLAKRIGAWPAVLAASAATAGAAWVVSDRRSAHS